MPNRFSGKLLDEKGEAINEVKVILKSGTVTQQTLTDKTGAFNITTPSDINPSDTTLTFSKSGLTLYKIKNPQSTGAYTPSKPQIDPIYGGLLNLKGGFAAGKYLITSLSPSIQEQLYWELFNILAFIKENPDNYNIVIVASESTITNYDREEFLEDGSPNPNWAGPTGTFKTSALPPKSLSDKRYQVLKKYIEDFFKENGSQIPTINSSILVGGNQESDQYIRLEAQLITVNCKTQPVQNEIQGDRTLIKPQGATKITLDAFLAPDRFGINGKYLDYYTQNPDTKGSVTSWEFIVYLSLYDTVLLNDNTIIRKEFNTDELKKIIIADIKVNNQVKIQLVKFLEKIKKISELGAKQFYNGISSDELLIDLVIQYTVGPRNPIVYGFPIKRENTVISLTNIGTNQSFILNQRNGVPVGESIYSFNICDNR
jgi:hypothetical protein